MKRVHLIIPVVLAFFTLTLAVSDLRAQEVRSMQLPELLQQLVDSHDRIKASEERLLSVEHARESAKGGWLPRLDATVEGGRENIDKPQVTATQMNRNEQTLTARQLIYDFGKVSGRVESADGVVREHEAKLAQAKQEVIALGITAYLRVVRSRELVKYAKRSEESIKELSGMQEILVERGAGYSYEELQVKGQLAGTQSYRVTQERELLTAINNFRSIFGFTPDQNQVAAMSPISVSRKFLPANVDEAVAIAFENNPLLLETRHSLERLAGDLQAEKSDYFPKFDAVLEAERMENDQGNEGVRNEQRGSLQMTYNLFSGFSDQEDILSVQSDMNSTRRMLLDRQRTIEESVRNAWLELTTLRKNVELYESQANITWEFLGLVKKKKAMGEEVRLLDILVGERDYINAISAKVATDIDTIIAGYTLLYQMGLITEDIVQM